MSRLPTVGGDTGTWGTVLNDFLTDQATVFALAASTAAEATTLTLNLVEGEAPLVGGQYLVVDAYTSQAEVRKITAVSGAGVTLVGALTYAHASGDRVLVVDAPYLTTAVWGCKGDNSTDDHTGLQEAVIQTTVHGGGLWLDGLNKTHIVSQPLLAAPSAKIRHMGIKAKSTFVPAESNNALVITMQGNILAFTASAATDSFTTPSAHDIPADNIGVIFQGTSLPGGITAGKLYYSRDRTALTFKVSATSGGAAVNITSNGLGRVFCEVRSLTKSYWDDVFIDGNNVASLNGVNASLQQPGFWNKVRIDNCPEKGLILNGQQHCLTNFESINCSKAVVLDNASFMWFSGFNAEQCDRGVYIDEGGAENCLFSGAHFEMNAGSGYATVSSVAIDIAYGCNNLTVQNLSVSMQAAGQKIMAVAAAISTSYTVTDARVAGASAGTGLIFLDDLSRDISLDAWDDLRFHVSSLCAPAAPSSFLYTDPYPYTVLGPGGRRVSWGSTIDSQPSHHVRPGSTQTGDQYRAEDTSGNRVSGFNKSGVFFTERNTIPGDGDLVAGELTLWFDDTNGSAKLMVKAKQADGTVRTGNVALT